ncbi:hypothetical protein MBLNU13_g01149t2 [Cladosporium sp. NU13]
MEVSNTKGIHKFSVANPVAYEQHGEIFTGLRWVVVSPLLRGDLRVEHKSVRCHQHQEVPGTALLNLHVASAAIDLPRQRSGKNHNQPRRYSRNIIRQSIEESKQRPTQSSSQARPAHLGFKDVSVKQQRSHFHATQRLILQERPPKMQDRSVRNGTMEKKIGFGEVYARRIWMSRVWPFQAVLTRRRRQPFDCDSVSMGASGSESPQLMEDEEYRDGEREERAWNR